MKYVLTAIIALVMLAGGIGHFVAPQNFFPLVPHFLPAKPVIAVTGVLEVAIGLAVLWPRSRAPASLVFALLCLGYLPLHLWDYVRPDPVFAPPVAATVRVAIQLVFIWIGWSLWIKAKN